MQWSVEGVILQLKIQAPPVQQSHHLQARLNIKTILYIYILNNTNILRQHVLFSTMRTNDMKLNNNSPHHVKSFSDQL